MNFKTTINWLFLAKSLRRTQVHWLPIGDQVCFPNFIERQFNAKTNRK